MKRLTLILIALLLSSSLYSQKTHNVTAKYVYYAPETMSIDEAKRIAVDRARMQAIADCFELRSLKAIPS